MRKEVLSRLTVGLLTLTLAALATVGCNGGASSSSGSTGEVRLQGAGATFPNPLYQKWFSEYNKTHPNSKFDYQSIGSGGGIKQISEGTVDFGGTDAPMKDEDMKAAKGGDILHVPTVLGAVVLTYNLPGVQGELKLTPEAVAGIFLGRITNWNDQAIASENPGLTLPANSITSVHRSDGSGTSYVFTDYLSKVSPEWKEKVGAGTSVQWPAGSNALGAKGNEGVTGQVKQTPNSIGYVELIYAEQQKLPAATLKNAAGRFAKPALQSITAAAASIAGQMPDDLRVSITNAPGPDAYPVSAFTYLLVYKDQKDPVKGKALVDFLWWAIHDGQQMASEMGYAPLPAEVVTRAEAKIKSITYQGKPLFADS
ncbi:MAG TPA: phosphate ABC transporter substrate-binding protein PstS [Blastocatellia bacterium]|jgi:phosphate transport system substrate-binding protein|nr:phosphate ABC transporter substrate-binding protein PstS [Blastocatellia bacterium]